MDTTNIHMELEKEREARVAAETRVSALLAELESVKASAGKSPAIASSSDALSNEHLCQLLATLQKGILSVEESGKVVIVNELFCRIFRIADHHGVLVGQDEATLLGRIKLIVKYPELYDRRIGELLAGREVSLNEELELRSGQIISFDYVPIFTRGVYSGHLWKYKDVTRNKTIEATFESQRKFYEQILNNTPADIVVCNSDYEYLYLNAAAIQETELRKWMIGKTVEEFHSHVKRPMAEAKERRAFFNQVKQTKTEQEREETITLSSGKKLYHLRKMYPLLDEQGEVEMVIGYGIDITERKKIEEQIKLSEKRYRDIFNFSKAWICTHDLMGRILSLNPAACEILDFRESELLGRQLESLLPEKYQADFAEVYMSKIVAQGKAEGIMKILSREKKEIYLLYQNYLVNEPDSDPYIIGFAQNISERIYAEEALKRSEEKYRTIIEHMNLGMIEIDPDENIIYANQRFCMMSGYGLDELVAKKATDLFLQGASLKKTRTQLSKGLYGITNSYELAIKTKSGEERWWFTSAAPVFGVDKKLKGTIGIHLDITDQKKLAAQLMESKLEADRLTRSKDIFLTNMSHEIRTPLNAIIGLGKLLSKDAITDKQRKFLAGIESASGSLLAIVNDLLDLSKIEAGKITIETIDFSLKEIATQVVSVLSHKAEEKGLVLFYDIDDKIARVLQGDPYRVNQVFMNMLSNAIKFTDQGTVSLSAKLLGQKAGRQQIRVVVRDTGIGIKPEYLDKLFDKFTQEDETVERKFGGTGLGMSITRQLIELMGGSITVESEKKKGTTVSLIFNFSIGSSKKPQSATSQQFNIGRIKDARILLAEDNQLNRLLAVTILTSSGAIVTEVENGEEAVAAIRSGEFDIVLMDIQMPVMDGIKATTIIRRERAGPLPIIALTANAIKGKEEQMLECGMNDYIAKPYTEAALLNTVAKWLSYEQQMDEQPENKKAGMEITVESEVAIATDELQEAPLYDISKLMHLAANDSTFVTKMLQLFISETSSALAKINEGYAAGDAKTVKYFSHRMKPSLGNLEIKNLREDILALEAIVEKNEQLDLHLARLNSMLPRVIEQIKADHNL